MKKKIILGVVVAILLFFVIPNGSNIIEHGKIIFQTVPAKYDDYENLRSLALSQKYDMQIIETSSVDYGKIKGDSLIWLVKRSRDRASADADTTMYYKINAKGRFIDSLTFINEYIGHFDNYLINAEKSYYTTWLMDGDTTKRSFVSIKNEDLLSETELTSYLENADYVDYMHMDDAEIQKRFQKILFYKDNIWTEVMTESDVFVSSKTYDEDNRLTFLDMNKLLKVSYYKKEIWNGHTFPDFGLHLNLNGRPVEHWRGASFYDFKMNNTTFSFKEPYVKFYKGNDTPNSRLSVYKDPGKKYIIINNGGYGNKDFTLYLIRF